MSIFLGIVGAFVLTAIIIYLWHYLQGLKVNFKSIKVYSVVFLQTLLSIINYDFINNYLRMFIIFAVMILSFIWLFKTNLHKAIITVFFTELIVILSECLYVILISLIMQLNVKELLKWFEGTFIIDISVALIMILISRLKIIKKIYKKLLSITDNIQVYQLFLFITIALSSLSYIYFVSYYSPNLFFTVIFNFIICLVYMTIILINFYNKNKYNAITAKYNNSLKDLIAYEKLNEKNRIMMHEDKNILKAIRSMTKNKKIIAFIDSVLGQKSKYNNTIDDKIIAIPYGGLKGTLHSKLSYMEDNNINYSLLIDGHIKYNLLNSIDDNLVVKICYVLGVLIDNAIEEVVKMDDGIIEMSIFKDGCNVCFSISNSYISKIDYNKIGVKPITSKGKNHGYGLMLVKTVVDEDDRLSLNRVIRKNIFKQELRVKIKN